MERKLVIELTPDEVRQIIFDHVKHLPIPEGMTIDPELIRDYDNIEIDWPEVHCHFREYTDEENGVLVGS